MNPTAVPWVVVPVRGFAQGKSRLAMTLAPEAREQLNRDLLARTLEAATTACGRPDRCVVVSPDAQARAMATAAGAGACDEPAPRAGARGPDASLNAALAAGVRHVARLGATHVLLLAADLPAIDADAIARFAASARPGTACLAPDRHGRGTNALLLPVGAEAALRFGADSLREHRIAFAALGIPLTEWHDPALAFDLDTPEDWALATGRAPLPVAGSRSAHAAGNMLIDPSPTRDRLPASAPQAPASAS